MNCKQGDLAIVVRSKAGNEGKIVRCVQFLGVMHYMDGDIQPSWRLDRKHRGVGGLVTDICPDAYLRPIRGQDGEDETLTWADKPQEVAA